ncbi:hypothetical protein QQF64_019616 [Cirrhinus molitorella]|uniref:Uncharacterized protein n=1 Tax=Cirrhinus molitorella TaxID=172907 RepID=A0ABR3LHC2_9TELE
MCEILPRSRCLNPAQACLADGGFINLRLRDFFLCVTPFIFTIVHFINRIMIFLIFLTVHKGVILIADSFLNPELITDQFICSLSEERGKHSPSEMSLSQKQSVRSGSHVSSSVSVKSDRSKDRNPNFSKEPSQTKRIKEAALDLTLYFLREMKQDEAADTLEEEELEEFVLQKFKKSESVSVRSMSVINTPKEAL